MEITWTFDEADIAACRQFIASQSTQPHVLERRRRNIRRTGIDISPSMVWRALVGCLITTRARSGPGTAVSQFLKSEVALLDVHACLGSNKIRSLAKHALVSAGLRRSNVVSKQVEHAVKQFRGESWKRLAASLNTIRKYPSLRKEREVAAVAQEMFKGLGPKQSRNFIQWIGLSRYVVLFAARPKAEDGHAFLGLWKIPVADNCDSRNSGEVDMRKKVG